MNFGDIIAKLAADNPQAALIVALFVVGILELVLGIIRAVSGGQFQLALIDVWVRTQLAGRILPIVLVLIVGIVFPPVTLGGFSFSPITIAANTAAAVYLAAAAASIVASLNPAAADPLPQE